MNLPSELVAVVLLYLQPVVAFAGILVNVLGVRKALGDLEFHEVEIEEKRRRRRRITPPDRARGVVAQLNVEYELIRLGIQGLLLFIGALVILNPPDHIDKPVVLILNRSALMACTVLAASKSILGQNGRRRVIEILQNGRGRRRREAARRDVRRKYKEAA